MKTFKLFLEQKMSQADVNYQDRPKAGNKCINCTMWRDPNRCSAVTGKISPNGWCNIFQGGSYGKRGNIV